MSNTQLVLEATNGTEQPATAVEKSNVHVRIVDSRIEYEESEHKYLPQPIESENLKVKVMKGTNVEVKIGANENVMPVDTTSKESCFKLAKSKIFTDILRAFDWTHYKGMKVPKIRFEFEGASKRFVMNKPEENETEQTYFIRNKAHIEQRLIDLTKVLMTSGNQLASIEGNMEQFDSVLDKI